MPDLTTEWIPTPTGVPQGSPISPILYLIYNADLLEQCATAGATAYGWVDDVGILAEGSNETATIELLRKAHDKAWQWAQRHASVFAPEKYELLHFVNPKGSIQPLNTSLTVIGKNQEEIIIKPKQEARYLGVWFDPQLTFEAHRTRALAKASGTLEAMRGLTGST